MLPTILWDGGPVRGWTVMDCLRERHQYLRNQAVQARRRQDRRKWRTNLPDVAFESAERDAVRAAWHGSTELLAFLFAHPDSSAIRVLHARREYFDIRSGEKWSLFFPGYYETGTSTRVRRDRYVGRPRETGEWDFDPAGFDTIRDHVARSCHGQWAYSGETDLVLVGVWLPDEGELAIDWESTTSGVLEESDNSRTGLTLGPVVESITNDFDNSLDPTSGLASLLAGDSQPPHSTMREFTTQVLSGVTTALVLHGLRLA